MDIVLCLCPSLPTEALKWLSSLPILMQKSFWWCQCSDRYILSLFGLTSSCLRRGTGRVDREHGGVGVGVGVWGGGVGGTTL